MIIVHAFTRKIKDREYLMVDTSADARSTPLFPSPEILFEATGKRNEWVPRVKHAITSRFPDLIAGDACLPGDTRKTKVQCFDIPFYEKGERSWLYNLFQ